MTRRKLFEEMPVFDPQGIEAGVYQSWETAGHFKPHGEGSAYCVMIPPPNVTGTLHMGHAFQNTLMDILIRHARMQGHRTLWQVGTDHAGIATQIVVERRLEQTGVTRQSLGREAFTSQIWDWKAESGGMITNQLRRLAVSTDWSRERFTMDPGLQDAVQEAFIRLYNDGLIEKRKRLVAWDPILQTALSDLEVVSQEQKGFLYHFRYPLEADPTQALVVATTRPETLFGDQAVAVHPEDPRYAHWIGQSVRLPLMDRVIPIIADEHVEIEFGTGCLKITPAHDFNDYEIGLRHQLAPLNILHANGTLNEQVPAPFQGLKMADARQAVLVALKEQGFFVDQVPHVLQVPTSEKNGTVLEPYLTEQWYVKMKEMAARAVEAVEKNDVQFVPENWSNTYFAWLKDIQDWCISRQLWWGHRIPVWTDPTGRFYVGRSEAEIRATHQISPDTVLKQDEDVLDTWFSSALWPFSTLGWPHHTEELATFYPTTVLVTGFDIIFFWVARMIMFGLYFTGKVPFKKVYIHGLVCDHNGQKMSKSKGNVLDPIDLVDGIDLETLVRKRTQNLMNPKMAPQIERVTRKEYPEGIRPFGLDPLRFTFAALASNSRKINFDLGRLEGYRNFCNKIWNAARFLDLKLEPFESAFPLSAVRESELSLWERAIWARLAKMLQDLEQALAEYRFDWASALVYEFTWGAYCDWFLEMGKIMLQDSGYSDQQKKSVAHTLLSVFEHLLRTLHPFMPLITEVLWADVSQKLDLNFKVDSVMVAPYPRAADLYWDEEALEQAEWLEGLVVAIRTLRSSIGISPKEELDLVLVCEKNADWIRAEQGIIQALCRLKHIEIRANRDHMPPALHGFYQGAELFLMLDQANLEQEIKRLKKEQEKMDQAILGIEKKLSNTQFVQNAPQPVVEQERERLSLLNDQKVRSESQLRSLMAS